MSRSSQTPHGQDDDEEWRREVNSLEVPPPRSVWVDGRFYVDAVTGKLNMAIRSGTIVLAAADPADQPRLEEILRKIVEHHRL